MEVVPLDRRYLINRRTVIATFYFEYSELLKANLILMVPVNT